MTIDISEPPSPPQAGKWPDAHILSRNVTTPRVVIVVIAAATNMALTVPDGNPHVFLDITVDDEKSKSAVVVRECVAYWWG